MLQGIPLPAAIVDIETTGGSVTYDRITEIGIINISEEGASEWSTLINPRQPIPPSIQRFTGITNEMVASAPYFEQVAKDILLRLQGHVFIAHNVRFDYGFIRNEFARLAYAFKVPLLCTVKLSRALYADRDGHSLEKIIARHQIQVTHRHRALDDARAAYRFLQIAEAEHGKEKVSLAVSQQRRRESLPPDFDPGLIEGLPNSPGVYYFWGADKELLYIGKSINIRKRVLSHFTADHKSAKEMALCQQTKSITFDETRGELSALILESQKIKALLPIYNRKLRRNRDLYSICLSENDKGVLTAHVIPLSKMPDAGTRLYGLFSSAKKARESIQHISDEYRLCYQACGLEPPGPRACMSHQLKKCQGLCVGKQHPLQHNVNMLAGFGALALKAWPYPGPIALAEPNQPLEDKQYLIINNWCVLGAVNTIDDYTTIADANQPPTIDRDIYRYLVRSLFRKNAGYTIIPLNDVSDTE